MPGNMTILERGEFNEKEKSQVNAQLSADTIDQLISEIVNTKDWSTLVPDYDEDALMVSWTSKS